MEKRKIIKYLVLIFLIGGVALGAYYYFYVYNKKDNSKTNQKETYFQVGTGDIISSIKVLGETNLLNEQKLKFNINGTVSGVYVKEGKIVKKGELLAELNKGELQNELKEVQINLENSKINLNKELEKLSTDDKIKDKSSIELQQRKIISLIYDLSFSKKDNKIKLIDKNKEIENSKQNLERLKKETFISKDKLSTDLKNDKNNLDYKKQSLNDEKWSLEKQIIDEQRALETKTNDYYQTFSSTYDNIKNDVSSFYDNLRSLNNYLKIDDEFGTKSSNIYFSAKNTNYKNLTENYYWTAKGLIKNLENDLKNNSSLNEQYLIKLLNQEKEILGNLYLAGENTALGADNSIESSDFLSNDISSIKSAGISIKSSSFSAKNNIDPTITKLKNLDKPDELKEKSRIAIEKFKKSIADLDKDLDKLQKDYDNLYTILPDKVKDLDISLEKETRNLNKLNIELSDFVYKTNQSYADKEIDIKNAKEDLEIMQKNYNKKFLNIAENEAIKLLKNEVKQREIAIDQVNKKIENYEIRASFAGVVDNFNLKVGDNLSTNSTDEKYIHLINPNLMEVKIKLDQIDIVKVKKGIEAQVKFDSYPDKIFTGTLDNIDSKPIDENGVKKYQVKMIIDKGELNIFSGMSANVDIVLEKKKNVILVPTMAIELDSEKQKNFVTIKKGTTKEKREVQLGLNSDGNTEIISGLKVGENVLQINFDANSFKVEEFSGPAYSM